MHNLNTQNLTLEPDFLYMKESGNRLFNYITWFFLVATILFSLVVKFTQLPEIPREEKEKLPVHLTKIIEQIELKEKPKVIPKPIEPEEKEIVEKIEKPIPKVVDVPKVKVADTSLEKAKDEAKRSGLLALADDLAQMRDTIETPTLATKPLSNQGAEEVKAKRKVLTSEFKATSKSLDTSKLTQAKGKQVALAQRELVALADVTTSSANATQSGIPVPEQESTGPTQKRKMESIRQVLDKNKGAFYTIYRRALRKDPALEGKVTMLIVVEGDGSVSSCKILSSELENSELEAKLIARVKLISFGKDLVTQTRLNYSFNFLPY